MSHSTLLLRAPANQTADSPQAFRRAASATTTSSSSCPSPSTTRTSSPRCCTSCPRSRPRTSWPSRPTWRRSTRTRSSRSRRCAPTSTRSTCPSTRSWRRRATCCSTASRTTTPSSTTTSTTSARSAASRPRSPPGSRSAKPRTPPALLLSRLRSRRMSGSVCSSCLRSRAVSRRC